MIKYKKLFVSGLPENDTMAFNTDVDIMPHARNLNNHPGQDRPHCLTNKRHAMFCFRKYLCKLGQNTVSAGYSGTCIDRFRDMIVVVSGLPGTGKSYFSGRLAGKTGAVHLNTDVIREKMHKQGKYDSVTNQQVYDRLEKEMAEKVSMGNDVVIDGTFRKRSHREQFRKRAGEEGVPVFFIEMQAGDQTVRERLRKSREHSEADYRVYLKLKSRFDPYAEQRLVLRSDRLSTDEMIGKAKKYIYEEGTGTINDG